MKDDVSEVRDGVECGIDLAGHKDIRAGDIIEIAPPHGPALLLPFTNAVVPSVDIAGGRVVVELPDEVEGEAPRDADL